MENLTTLKEKNAKNIYALLMTAGSAFEKLGGMVAFTHVMRDDMADYIKFAVKIATKANQEEDKPDDELSEAIKDAQALVLKISNK